MCRPLDLTGGVRECLNLGSYNYLGFAARDEYCTPRVQETLRQQGWSMCSSRTEAGLLCCARPVQNLLNQLVNGQKLFRRVWQRALPP